MSNLPPLGRDASPGLRHIVAAARGACLRILPPAGAHALPIRLESEAGQTHSGLLPCEGLRQVCLSLEQPLHVYAGEACIEPLGAAAFWRGVGLASLLRDPIIRARDAGVTLLLQARGANERAELRKQLKILSLFDLGPQLRSGAAGDGLAFGFSVRPPVRSSQRRSTLRLGVVVHLHFIDVWPDIEASLRCIPSAFGLIVTLTGHDASMERAIRDAFPQADIRIVPNAGRDVRPFLALLEDGDLDRFDIVCKVHGKKSLRNGGPTALGELWRRHALHDLIAGTGQFDEVLARFEADPRLGLLGPQRFRVPNERFSLHDAWSGNQTETRRLAARLGLPATFDLDFFAGTMFWVRPAALARLRGVGLGDPSAYAPESGRTDGALEHALERLFTTSVVAGGFTLGALAPLPPARS